MTEESLFTAAMELPTKAGRASFLEQPCAGDAAMRRRVEALLESHEESAFLRTSAAERAVVAFGGKAADGTTEPADGAGEDLTLDVLAPAEAPGSLGRLGHYEVFEVLGRGGMGVVLRAFDQTLHRVVAIKVMAAQLATSAVARRRFIREARAAAAVSHDHIVTIHAVEGCGPLPYIVMQYVAGRSLQNRLDRNGPLQLHEVLRIGVQIASGLAAAHAQGLVHRAVKPANILLENGIERVKLTDFGLARAADDASLTQSGTVAGTPAFMSPEQAEGRPVDHRSDLFSLGSVLYAICTGRPPFRAGTSMGVLRRVCEDAPSPIRESNPEIPDRLAAVVEKLHGKDPAGRFQSAAEVAEVLGRHLAQTQHPSVGPLLDVAGPAGNPPVMVRPEGHMRWAVTATVLLATDAVLATTAATGVANVRATMVRVLTPDGTLIVETDDPGVKVTVEGDGGLALTTAGLQEIRLKPGSYRVLADRNGKPLPLERELVTVARHGREIIRMKLESARPAPDEPTSKGAFVLLAAGPERQFDTLAEAMLGSADGDAIEVRGNGPFASGPVTISNRRALTIRAGSGFHPLLERSQEAVENQPYLLATNGPLVLEGLELRLERGAVAKTPSGVDAVVTKDLLHVANCRFIAPFRHALFASGSRRVAVMNCEFLGTPVAWSDALTGHPPPGGVWALDNCVQVGGTTVSCGMSFPYGEERMVRIRRSSLVGCVPLRCNLYRVPKDLDLAIATGAVRVEALGSLLPAGQLAGIGWSPNATHGNQVLSAFSPEEAIPRLVAWNGSANVHHREGKGPAGPAGPMIRLGTEKGERWAPGIVDLAAWRSYWGSPETGSVEGEVRYRGGDLAGRLPGGAESMAPEDFRLRPDSAGYRAGQDGKDVGADIDLVGPGPAYERWKKTPAYERWVKETGQFPN